MSFDSAFERVWSEVIVPAVGAVSVDGQPLKAHRVNLTKKSDAILTEIVQRIADSRLIVADITTIGWLNQGTASARPVRNANVMYELGIAHASRLPEEVVIVRGDNDPLDFDIAGVRVLQYPTDQTDATAIIEDLVRNALSAIDQRRSVAVRLAVQALTPPMYIELHNMGAIAYPDATTVGESLGLPARLDTVNRLLDAGLIEARFEPLTDGFMERPIAQLFSFVVTPFGRAVYQAARGRLGFNAAFKRFLETAEGKTWLLKNERGDLSQG